VPLGLDARIWLLPNGLFAQEALKRHASVYRTRPFQFFIKPLRDFFMVRRKQADGLSGHGAGRPLRRRPGRLGW